MRCPMTPPRRDDTDEHVPFEERNKFTRSPASACQCGASSPHALRESSIPQEYDCNGGGDDDSIKSEVQNMAHLLSCALDKFLCDKDDFALQLKSHQFHLLRILESIQFSEHAGHDTVTPRDQECTTPDSIRDGKVSSVQIFSEAEFLESSARSTFGSGEAPDPRQAASYHTNMNGHPASYNTNMNGHSKAPLPKASLIFDNKSSLRSMKGADTRSTDESERRMPTSPNHLKIWLKQRKAKPVQIFNHSHCSLRKEYEWVFGVVLMANAAYIGWEVQYAGQNLSTEFDGSRVGSMFFITVYFFDLAYRGHGQRFRYCGWKALCGSIFGVIVFATMVAEECLRLADHLDSIHVLRVLRFLRLVRILHVVRFFVLSRHFRLLVFTVQKCLSAMFWVLVLCALTIYTFSVAMAQGALEYCDASNTSDPSCKAFGKLSDATLNLCKAMLGGALWGDFYDQASAFGWVFQVLLLLFVFLSLTIVLNVITGVVLVLHHEIHHTETETLIDTWLYRRRKFVQKMYDIFEILDINCSGGVSLEELRYAAEDHRMVALLERMGLDTNDIEGLFLMLDQDDSGTIDVEEFVLGSMRLHGEAKAINVHKVRLEIGYVKKTVEQIVEKLNTELHAEELGSSDSLMEGSRHSFRRISTTWGHSRSRCSTSWGKMASPYSRVPVSAPVLIENVVMRAMTMANLKAARSLVLRCCINERWMNPKNGQKLDPKSVNLYDLSYNFISPRSAPEGTLLYGLNHDLVSEGQNIVEMDRNSSWRRTLAEGRVINDPRSDGYVHVMVSRGRFRASSEIAISEDVCVTADGTDVGITAEVVTSVSLSYKELMHPVPTKPKWFCSHWWGEPISDFVACCEKHAEFRERETSDATYWICAYANRQHDLSTDISSDPDKSSFRKAMKAATGTLLILDDCATPFKRIWCDFELYHTINDDKLLDIATVFGNNSKREPQLLSQGLLPGETMLNKMGREAFFPINLFIDGLNARLEDGDASVLSDKEQILLCMGKDKATGQPGDAAALADALRRANSILHSYLVQAAWPQALKKKRVEDFDPMSPGTICLPHILAQDVERRELHLSFASISEFYDAEMKSIARGLPGNLTQLHLGFEGCYHITDQSMHYLGNRLPSGLTALVLDFVGCTNITDEGMASLAVGLPSNLRELRLDFALCSHIGLPSIQVLASHLPKSLVRFVATFQGTEIDRKFNSVQELQTFLKSRQLRLSSLFDMGQMLRLPTRRY